MSTLRENDGTARHNNFFNFYRLFAAGSTSNRWYWNHYKAHNIRARLYLVACMLSICHRPTYNGELLVINILEGSGISSWAPCWWRFLVQPILTFIGWMMTCMVWKFLSQKLATCSICVGVYARWWLWWWCTCMVHEIQNCNSHSGWLYMVTHQSVFCTILGANLEILLKGSCII